jgi:hypothetical protein
MTNEHPIPAIQMSTKPFMPPKAAKEAMSANSIHGNSQQNGPHPPAGTVSDKEMRQRERHSAEDDDPNAKRGYFIGQSRRENPRHHAQKESPFDDGFDFLPTAHSKLLNKCIGLLKNQVNRL